MKVLRTEDFLLLLGIASLWLPFGLPLFIADEIRWKSWDVITVRQNDSKLPTSLISSFSSCDTGGLNCT